MILINISKPSFIRFFIAFVIFMITHVIALKAQIMSHQEQFEDVNIKVNVTPYSLAFYISDNENYTLEEVVCKNIKNEEIFANDQHICENLDPCSSYLSILTLLHKSENQTIEKTYDAKTAYREPITSIGKVETFADSINLTWSTSDRSCVSKYVIVAKSLENTITNEIFNDKTFFLINNLDSCQKYDIQLRTYNNNSEFISNKTTSSLTDYSEPGTIVITNITNLANGHTTVTWNLPDHKNCIEKYILKWYLVDCSKEADTHLNKTNSIIQDKCEWTDTLSDNNRKQYVLYELQGCEIYVFRMFINENETIKAEQEFKSAEKIPTNVINQEWNISSTTVEMRWRAPKDHSKCIDFYSVNVTSPYVGDLPLVEITRDTFIIFENMEPCGQYEVNIISHTLNGTLGPSLQETFVMLEAQPTAISNPQVIKAEAYMLNISWLKPNFADLCITGYRLSGWRDDNITVDALSVVTNETNIVFDRGLNSCQAYTIQIIPITNTMDGELKQFDVETSAIVVDSLKTTLQVIHKFPNSLELSALSKDVNNTCQTIFAHFYCITTAEVPYQYAETYTEGHVGDISFRAILQPLSPFTDYGCHVVLYNIAGASNDYKIIQKTDYYFPEEPKELVLLNSSFNSLMFQWKAPRLQNGNIKLYFLYLQHYEADYFIPPGCGTEGIDLISSQTPNLEYTFPNLLPAIKYSIQIAAQNEYGIGQISSPNIFLTLPWISDPIINLNISTEGPHEVEEDYKASVIVSFQIPCKSNGKIESFILEFVGERARYEIQKFKRIVLPNYDFYGQIIHNESNLQPEYNYNVTITVKTVNVDTLSTSISGNFDSPAGIPKRLNDDVTTNIYVNTYETKHPTRSAVVRIPSNVLNSDSGTIIYMALLVSQKDCADNPRLQFGALDTNLYWPDTPSWQEIYGENRDCIRQYQTTPKRWKPYVKSSNNYNQKMNSNVGEIVYTIGEDNCDINMVNYCNGPLRAETEYNLVIRLFTKSGYNDVAVASFKTDSVIKVTLILVSVSCCLLLAFLIGLIVLWMKNRLAWHRDSEQGIEDPFGNVTAKNFGIFYSQFSKPEKISREFKEISVAALELSYAASETGCHKNRYADIYPYDKNRVILDIDAEGSDYINASFIDGFTRKKEYIATQGPKPESTMDFWRMILQYNVRIIVMVTQFREGNQVKCHEYFPYSSKSGFNVTVKSKECFELYDRTEISVSHEKYGLKQKVVHFYYKNWPDHSCPEDPMHLIHFIRKVKAEKRPSYSPIVVHCSAGVGRTGVVIALDIIMQRLKSESKINIFETVKKLRFQRMKMVQTVEQYNFLYACAFELVKHKIPRSAFKHKNHLKNFDQSKNKAQVKRKCRNGELNVNCNLTTQIPTYIGLRSLESLDEQPDKEFNGSDSIKNVIQSNL